MMLIIGTGQNINAQTVQVVHDKQKEKQWRSMETGLWGFEPDWYYYFLHKDYSGASASWQWHGFNSGYRVSFSEQKSNIKTINPTRILSEETQRAKLKKAEDERSKIEELYKEDLIKQSDRLIDTSYSLYRDDFNKMQNTIADGLVLCMKKSGGKMQRQIDEISRANEILCSNIEYIKKTGYGNELESSKRQRAYEDAKNEMQKLTIRTVRLTALAFSIYK